MFIVYLPGVGHSGYILQVLRGTLPTTRLKAALKDVVFVSPSSCLAHTRTLANNGDRLPMIDVPRKDRAPQGAAPVSRHHSVSVAPGAAAPTGRAGLRSRTTRCRRAIKRSSPYCPERTLQQIRQRVYVPQLAILTRTRCVSGAPRPFALPAPKVHHTTTSPSLHPPRTGVGDVHARRHAGFAGVRIRAARGGGATFDTHAGITPCTRSTFASRKASR